MLINDLWGVWCIVPLNMVFINWPNSFSMDELGVTCKTFLNNLILMDIHSKCEIIFTMASLQIIILLFQGGQTTHS